MKRRPGPEGFTLIELLVVLSLIAMVASLAWPQLSVLSVKARRSEARAALLQAMQQEERYFSANGRYIEFSRTNSNGFAWHSGATPAGSSHEMQAQACADSSLDECVQISATPGTEWVNPGANDSQCGVLSLNSRGEKASDGSPALCWP